jgi:hypothetical protein
MSQRHASSETIICAQTFFHHLLFSPTYTRMKMVAANHTACAPLWMKSSSATVGICCAMGSSPPSGLLQETVHHLLEAVTLTNVLRSIPELAEVLLHRSHQAHLLSRSRHLLASLFTDPRVMVEAYEHLKTP